MRLRNQKGLSLVELMISLAIGSLITAGIVQLYTANSATYGLVLGQSRMQESARFALAFISRDVQRAGYRGCFSSNSQLHWTISDPVNLPYEFDLRSGLEGYNGTAGGNWSPSLNAIPASSQGFVAGTGIDRSSIVSGTDVLTLRNIVQQTVDNPSQDAVLTLLREVATEALAKKPSDPVNLEGYVNLLPSWSRRNCSS